MKKLFVLALLSISLSSFGQARRDSLPPIKYQDGSSLKGADYVATQLRLTDTTMIISLEMLGKYADVLKDKMLARQFEHFVMGLNQVVKQAIDEWERSHKSPQFQSPNPKPKQK
jgi:hypothetical protein